MPTLPLRAAAYTRTGILKRFLDQLADSLPPRVDSGYAEVRLGLKGGDVRAFLQSLRVLGLVDPYGQLTDRARRTRGLSQRSAAIRDGLREAYPELFERWDRRGGMPREEVEDFFKVEYGLSASSAAPAAKLFTDLLREYGAREERLRWDLPFSPTVVVPAGEPSAPPEPVAPAAAPGNVAPETASPTEVRLAALDLIKSSIRIDINAEWDEKKIELVFDRMERLVNRILAEGR